MPRVDFNNLQAFVLVARERSFTRAAAQLGVSQSALSHTIKSLEARLGIRLLTRSTRGVSPTEAGERLMVSLGAHYDSIELELSALSELMDKPAGRIRITAHDHAVNTVLWPRLSKLLPQYPDIQLEIAVNYRMVDIVAERYDAGVRLGDQVAKDMIAVRIAPDLCMAVVGAPSYLERHGVPGNPQQLSEHNCITLRLPTYGGINPWELHKDGKTSTVHVQGQLIFATTPQKVTAALEGHGLTTMPLDIAQAYFDNGQLRPVLQEWWPTYQGYHLYYPNRRQPSAAFSLIVDALRYQAGGPAFHESDS